jgi:transcriptional regulator with XRE-family HTH domain
MTLDGVKRHFIAGWKGWLYNSQMRIAPIRAFGKRLEEAIKSADLSQADLARHFKITPQAIYGWTKAKNPPALTIDRWVSLSLLLNVNLEWLSLGIGQRERAEMDSEAFNMLRRFQQLEPAQKQVISATIDSLLSQNSGSVNFDQGKRR